MRNTIAVAVVLALGSLVSCKDQPVEQDQQPLVPPPAEPFSVDRVNELGWEKFAEVLAALVVDPYVTLAELNEDTMLFNDAFRLVDKSRVQTIEHTIPWDSLVEKLPKVIPDHDRAVAFHYGMEGGKFHLGWSYRYVDQAQNSQNRYDMTDPGNEIHEMVAGAVKTVPKDDWIWKYQLDPAVDSYFNDIEINRLVEGSTTNHWDPVNASDVNSCTFLWEDRLWELMNDNRPEFPNTKRLHLVVNCSATWRMGSDAKNHLYHTLCAHLRIIPAAGPIRNLISNTPHGQNDGRYYMRGANYGNLCPIRCNEMQK